jgi:hypothetical protein
MKMRLGWFVVLALLTLPACNFVTSMIGGGTSTGGSSAGNGSGGATSQQIQNLLNTPVNPISLTLDLDQTHKAQALITRAGGQVKATGADGAVFTLDVPKDALATPTTITLTPISRVTGLPGSGSQTYAVQAEPEGLYFYNDAILTITPAKPIALDKQVFFDFASGGRSVGLALPVVESKDIQLRLMHFSGYGVSDGGPATAQAVQQQSGGSAESALQSQAAGVLDQMRQDQAAGKPADGSSAKAILDLMDQWDAQVVKPAVEAAGDSCQAGKEALGKVLDAARLRQLLGAGGDLGADFTNLLAKASKTCVESEYVHCAGQHVVNGMIPLWLGLKRQQQLMGDAGPAMTAVVQLAESLTVKCLTFELRFHSQGIFAASDAGYDSTVDGKVTLRFDPNSFTISGSGQLDNPAFKFKMPANTRHSACTVDSHQGGSTFEVKQMAYKEDKHSASDKTFYVSDWNLVYFPGVTSESYHIHCTLTDSQGNKSEEDYTSPPSGYWTGIFFVTHQDELNAQSGAQGGPPPMPDMSSLLGGGAAAGNALPAFPAPDMPPEGGFVADRWNVTVGDLLAAKDWTRSNGAAGLTEVGTLKLYHRPGQ